MSRIPFLLLCFLFSFFACDHADKQNGITAETSPIQYKSQLDQTAKDYWYGGTAEITSYQLTQARYGELREGDAVLIFVTEPFSKTSNTKADNASPDNVSVLKLNTTKKFNTGIYPYSMMNSTFYPVDVGNHSLKVTSSSQEWCGHTYMELVNRGNFDLRIDSYFEGETAAITLGESWIEDDIWSIIRLRPSELPLGEIEMLPSFFFLRLKHKNAQAYKATASLKEDSEFNTYTINYPELDRQLSIHFKSTFPFSILGWEETYASGFGPDAQKMTTTAKKIKTLKTPYWQQNGNKHEVLRDSLGLK